jgi:hypothetical protein
MNACAAVTVTGDAACDGAVEGDEDPQAATMAAMAAAGTSRSTGCRVSTEAPNSSASRGL